MDKEMPKEYTLLFNAVTDAITALEYLQLRLAIAQQEAECLYMERTE